MHGLFLGAAAAGAQGLSWSARTTVAVGEAPPAITFRSSDPGQLDVRLQCAGLPIQVSGAIGPGRDVVVSLDGLAEGRTPCAGRATFDGVDGGAGEMVVQIDATILPQLGFTPQPDDVDRGARRAVLHPNRPVASLSAGLVGPEGRALGEATVDLTDPMRPVLAWSTPEEVVRIDVLASDGAGFRAVLELSPWSYVIPHEDVVFPSGSAELNAPEVEKLRRTWTELQSVLARYGQVVRVQLYVAGYTDTVGDAGGNLGLSERRARSIAAWFRGQGLTVPIWYQGFGERVPAVPTGDGVDEVRNRRALYVLAADAPSGVPDLPEANWRRL